MMRWFLKTWRDNESEARLLYLCERQKIPKQRARRRKRIKNFATWEVFILSSLLLIFFRTLDCSGQINNKVMCSLMDYHLWNLVVPWPVLHLEHFVHVWVVLLMNWRSVSLFYKTFSRVLSVLNRHDIANNLLSHQYYSTTTSFLMYTVLNSLFLCSIRMWMEIKMWSWESANTVRCTQTTVFLISVCTLSSIAQSYSHLKHRQYTTF